MAYTLKDKIFGFFGLDAKVRDTSKDVNGKGISERYNESLGEDYDDNVRDLVDNFHDNLYDPFLCKSQFIKFLEYNVGSPVIVVNTDAFRRKLIAFNNTITLIKGTQLSHEVLFGMLGVSNVDIDIVNKVSGFDSEVTLDDVHRTFDSGALCCQHYTITLAGASAIDDTLIESLIRIAFYLKPINGEIDFIEYNGTVIYGAPPESLILDDGGYLMTDDGQELLTD